MTVPRLSVREILFPRAVAVFGASDNTDKFGGRIMHYLTRHRYSGRVLPINPNRDQVLGLPAFPSIAAAPGPVDVAMLAVPARALVQSVRECADAGVGACVIMTTGFAEASAEGASAQAELVAIAKAAGMRIVGPNCMGLINPLGNLALTSSLVLDIEAMRTGSVGLVSQSGALMVSMFNRAHDAGIGFSTCVSLGNQCDLEICDFVEYLIDDPKTRAICLYVEGFVDPLRFLRAAERARERGKPVLVVKTGRTAPGVRAARSHTASLAGSYAVFKSACRARGVLLTDDPDGMVRVADMLTRWPNMTGEGIGVLSPSGGGASIGVDRVTERGLRLAQLRPETKAKLLEDLIPPQADNPIDLGGRRDGDSVKTAAKVMTPLATDPDVAAVFIVLTTVPFYEATTRELAVAALASGKPVVVAVTPGSAADGPRRALREVGAPYFDSVDEALHALELLVEHVRLRAVPPISAPSWPADLPAPNGLAGLPAGALTEPEVKQVLARYGIAVTRERLARDAGAAAQEAAALGFPVVLKAVARQIVHKSDAGGVKLGLTNGAAVQKAWAEIAASVGRHLPGVALDGMLVQEMIQGEAELIVGIRRDEQFGAVVLVGFGGIFVEIMEDVQMALAPVSPAEATAMLRQLKLWPLLAGARGRPPLDMARVADVVARLSWLGRDLGPRLVELEINPLMVRTDGAVAVDGRATLAP